jgi:transcriptional regulator with XRE-family HTH domain
MPKVHPTIFPGLGRHLAALGERLRLARFRRNYSAVTLATRAGLARATLYRVERGDPSVSIAAYASILRVLGLHADIDTLARDDALGRKLQDLQLPKRRRASSRPAPPDVRAIKPKP